MANYTDLIKIFNSIDESGAKMWMFDKITSHGQLPDDYWEVKVLWYTG